MLVFVLGYTLTLLGVISMVLLSRKVLSWCPFDTSNLLKSIFNHWCSFEHITAMWRFGYLTNRPTFTNSLLFKLAMILLQLLSYLFIYCYIVAFSCHGDFIAHWFTILHGPIQLQSWPPAQVQSPCPIQHFHEDPL